MKVRGDQQVEGESFDPADIYAPVLKHYEAWLILAIAAAEGCPVQLAARGTKERARLG